MTEEIGKMIKWQNYLTAKHGELTESWSTESFGRFSHGVSGALCASGFTCMKLGLFVVLRCR